MPPRPRTGATSAVRPVAPAGRYALRPVILAAVLLAGCDIVADRLSPPPPSAHAEYVDGLTDADLAGTPLARAWIAAGRDAVTLQGGGSAAPAERTGWFAADSPSAAVVRVSAAGARWLTVRTELSAPPGTRLFIDAFRLPRDAADPPRVLASAGDSIRTLSFRVRGDDDVLVRVQPELLRGGAYTVRVTASDDQPEAGR